MYGMRNNLVHIQQEITQWVKVHVPDGVGEVQQKMGDDEGVYEPIPN